ncbi:MAG: hypothetical protein J6Z22_04345 [Lachnospiraceae bacterium]|nr:hypothetical protein [Lachnospiraceae bacterium]
MFKLHMALGWSVIKMYLMPAYRVKHPELLEKIGQHRFVISDKIDAYYAENAEKEGLLEEYRDFISSIGSLDRCEEIRDGFNDVSQSIAYFFKNKCKGLSIVICEADEFHVSKSSCRHQYSADQAFENETGILNMYSAVSSFMIYKDERADEVVDWIRNLISEEKEISLIDGYLLNNSQHYKYMTDFYFKMIPSGCKLNLHVPRFSEMIGQAQHDAKEKNIDLCVYEYNPMEHERYIVTRNRIIVVGLGLDFMIDSFGEIFMRKGCNFTLRFRDDKSPYMELEHKLSGTLVTE